MSTDGGLDPVWSLRGGELFFRSDNRMMSVPIRQDPTPQFGEPVRLRFVEDPRVTGGLAQSVKVQERRISARQRPWWAIECAVARRHLEKEAGVKERLEHWPGYIRPVCVVL